MKRNESKRGTPARGQKKGSDASSPSSCLLSDAVAAVRESLTESAHLVPGTLKTYGDIMERFAAYGTASGVRVADEVSGDLVAAFMDARHAGGNVPTASTRNTRAQSVRLLFREARRLGIASIDPTMDITLPRLPATSTRPLTDGEVDLCRRYALASAEDLRRPVAWALAETGGRPSEIGELRVADVDAADGLIRYPGSKRYGSRHVPLTEWGRKQIDRRLALKSSKDEDLLMVGKAKVPKAARSTATMAIIDTLKAADLHEERAVRPHSVGLWRGVSWLTEGRTIDEVTWLLGYGNLDTAAEALGYEWWNR